MVGECETTHLLVTLSILMIFLLHRPAEQKSILPSIKNAVQLFAQSMQNETQLKRKKKLRNSKIMQVGLLSITLFSFCYILTALYLYIYFELAVGESLFHSFYQSSIGYLCFNLVQCTTPLFFKEEHNFSDILLTQHLLIFLAETSVFRAIHENIIILIAEIYSCYKAGHKYLSFASSYLSSLFLLYAFTGFTFTYYLYRWIYYDFLNKLKICVGIIWQQSQMNHPVQFFQLSIIFSYWFCLRKILVDLELQFQQEKKEKRFFKLAIDLRVLCYLRECCQPDHVVKLDEKMTEQMSFMGLSDLCDHL